MVLATTGGSGPTAATWPPAIDTVFDGAKIRVRAQLPEIDPAADVDIELENGVLTISGERRHESKVERNGIVRTDRSYGSFARSIGVPDGVEAEHVRATYDKGILEVVIALPATQAKKVKVEVATRSEPEE